METEEKKEAIDLMSVMGEIRYFGRLKPYKDKDNLFTVDLKVTGYTDLSLMITDLLKASISALEFDSECISTAVSSPEINVMGLLEIALQLFPLGEMELLDEIHSFYLKQKKESDSTK